MDKKHESEISVLRGEQARRMTQRTHRQDVELQQLEHRQKMELESLDEQYACALEEWDSETDSMRDRLHGWWHLRMEIWRKMLERETGSVFHGILPPVEWPNEAVSSESVEKSRRDTLNESPTGSGAMISREPSSTKSATSSSMTKEIGISTTFAVRSNVVGQA